MSSCIEGIRLQPRDILVSLAIPVEPVSTVLCYGRDQGSVAQEEHGALVLQACGTLRSSRSFLLDQIDTFQLDPNHCQ
jgi:hypothetical protein